MGEGDGRADPARVAVEALVAETLGLRVTGIQALPGGLGTRCFLRVSTGGSPGTLIARIDAPEDPAVRPTGTAPEPPLEPIRSVLARAGLPVPEHYGSDPAHGIELLEDVGERSLESAARKAGPAGRRTLYAAAVALVPQIQAIDPGEAPPEAFGRRLDPELIAFKGRLFAEWSLPAALGRPARPAERTVVTDAFAWIAGALATAPHRLAHRDFQSRNLHVRDDGRLALLDFQGAFLAPPEYDLVCLLRDSYVELPDGEVHEHLAEVRGALPDHPSADDLACRFDLLTLTRKGKDHARFLQAAARGEGEYVAHIPATVRALSAAAARAAEREPRLTGLADLVVGLPETGGTACGR